MQRFESILKRVSDCEVGAWSLQIFDRGPITDLTPHEEAFWGPIEASRSLEEIV